MTKSEANKVYAINYKSWSESVAKLLENSGLAELLPDGKKILLKPNLVTNDPPPITTPVDFTRAVSDFILSVKPDAQIIIAEGCGATEYDTFTPFKELGYKKLADEKGFELIDLNTAPLVKLSKPECKRWPEFFMPQVIMESFLISLPVLKAHSIADVTLTMKNMMGAAPPEHYNAGSWQKSAFHSQMHEAIFDMNRYRTPDFTVLDATIGMRDAHLWGPSCDPEPRLLAASVDPVAIDAFGTGVLKRKWKQIGHIKMADGVLGFAEAEVVRL
jgi:uncharacterized protein (DUF362 family)